jgi:hypothetical protein
MRQYNNFSALLNLCGELQLRVPTARASSVGDYEKAAAWVCLLQLLKFGLYSSLLASIRPVLNKHEGRTLYSS